MKKTVSKPAPMKSHPGKAKPIATPPPPAPKSAPEAPAPKREPKAPAKATKFDELKAQVAAKLKAPPVTPKVDPFVVGGRWQRGVQVYEVKQVSGENVTLAGGRTGAAFTTSKSKLLLQYQPTQAKATNLPAVPAAASMPKPKPQATKEAQDKAEDARLAKLFSGNLSSAPPAPAIGILMAHVTIEDAKGKTVIELPVGTFGWISAYQGDVWFAPKKKHDGSFIDPFPVRNGEWLWDMSGERA